MNTVRKTHLAIPEATSNIEAFCFRASVLFSIQSSTDSATSVLTQNSVDNYLAENVNLNVNLNGNVDVVAVLNYIVKIMLTTASSWIIAIYAF
jgi:hypothetical protein